MTATKQKINHRLLYFTAGSGMKMAYDKNYILYIDLLNFNLRTNKKYTPLVYFLYTEIERD